MDQQEEVHSDYHFVNDFDGEKSLHILQHLNTLVQSQQQQKKIRKLSFLNSHIQHQTFEMLHSIIEHFQVQNLSIESNFYMKNQELGKTLFSQEHLKYLISLQTLSFRSCHFRSHTQLKFLQNYFHSQYCNSLRKLNFHSTEINDEFLILLANSQSLNNLKKLTISQCFKLSDKGVSALFQSPLLQNTLISLDMENTKITDTSLLALSKSQIPWIIEHLVISLCSNLTDQGIKYLIDEQYHTKPDKWAKLQQLEINTTRITCTSLTYLFCSPKTTNSLPSLKYFNVHECLRLSPSSFGQTIFSWQYFEKLETLDISMTYVDDSSFQVLVDYPQDKVCNLKVLKIYECTNISQQMYEKFFSCSKVCENIEKLDISQIPQINDQVLKIIVDSKYFKKIKILNLQNCPFITDESMEYLIKSQDKGANLQYLQLSQVQVTQKFIKEFISLCEKNWFKHIEELDIRSCKQLKKEDVQLLKDYWKQKKFTNLQIVTNFN